MEEREALRQSAAAFEDERPDDCMRIATIVHDNVTEHEAGRIAEERFDEALDVLGSVAGGLSPMVLLASGLFENLEKRSIHPRTLGQGRQQGPSFWVARERFPQCDWPQFLLTHAKSELAQRLIRSHHWSRKAQGEAGLQLRVLFRWFAMEAVWLLNKNDDIVPRLQWALGFPNGLGAKALSPTFTKRLEEHPTIGAWKSQIETLLADVREFRNNSVHSGFRYQDISRTRLRDFDAITLLACARVQNLAQAAIRAGLSTTNEMFEYLPVLVEMNSHYIDDVHGSVLSSLENPRRGD